MQLKSDRKRSFNPASLWEINENPQVQHDCANFRGKETKTQGRSAVPKVAVKTGRPVAWSKSRGREDVTSGQTELSQTLHILGSSGTSLQLSL